MMYSHIRLFVASRYMTAKEFAAEILIIQNLALGV
jgi:hypothetical protein